jgi:hypothetical protein
LTGGRLPVRDAILMQHTLIDLLDAHLTTQYELCRASVALARALGRNLQEVN